MRLLQCIFDARRRRMRLALLSAIVALVFLGLLLPWVGLRAASTLLVVRQDPQIADVIVVLGGEVESRSAKAIELYRQGWAHNILVVGRNEEKLIGKKLRTADIPEAVLRFELESTSTYENVLFSLPLLQGMQAESILLVTSWFHSRRATLAFRSFKGGPSVTSVPTAPTPLKALIGSKRIYTQVLKEYLKIIGYWCRYGIMPVDFSNDASHPLSKCLVGKQSL